MSNRSSSKQHGCHRIKRLQPSKIWRKKSNKWKNKVRQQERQNSIQKALEAVPALAA